MGNNAEKDRIIAEQKKALDEKDEVLTEKDLAIKHLTAELERLKNQ